MRSPYFLSRECDYDTAGVPGLLTTLSTEWDDSTSDAEVLDLVFTAELIANVEAATS